MPRCGCSGTCSCLIEPGEGIQIDGIGTVENPYVIASDAVDLAGRLIFNDSTTVDFTQTGTGTLANPLEVTARATVRMEDLLDVQAGASNNQVLVWVTDHWEPQDQSGSGGGLPSGGATGQVLTKVSNADGDANWQTPASGGGSAEPIYAVSRAHAAATSIPHAVTTPVPWDTGAYQDGITFDGVDGFIVPVDGYYQVNAIVSWAQPTAGGTGVRGCMVTVDNSSYQSDVVTMNPGSQVVSAMNSVLVKATAGQVIRVAAYQTSGAALALSGNAAYNRVSIVKVPSTIPAASGTIGERVYAAARGNASGYSVPNSSTQSVVPFETQIKSDGIAWDVANNAYIIPATGWYKVSGALQFAANAAGYRLICVAVNGSQVGVTSDVPNSATAGQSVVISEDLYLNAGDKVTLRTAQTSGVALALTASTAYNFFTITKVPNVFPQSIAIGEQVYAIAYRQMSGQSFASGGNGEAVLWDTLDYSEGGITYDGAGRFTVPVAGYYQVNTKVHWAANATGRRRIRIGVDGSSGVAGIKTDIPTSGADSLVYGFSRVVKCNAGSQIIVGVDHTAGVALTVGSYTSVDITKVPSPTVAGSAASGVWGSGPLAGLGSDTLIGEVIYVDDNRQLRAQPRKKVQSGVVTMPAIPANGGAAQAVTFPVPFSVPPVVVVSAGSNGYGAASTDAPTATGFTAKYYNPTASVPSGAKVYWIAYEA